MVKVGQRLNKRTAGRGPGRPSDITNEFRDMVTTRAMELRTASYTLQETTDIVNSEFGDKLSITSIRKWLEDRIKPQLEEKADTYRQHMLDQIALQKRRLEKKCAMGDAIAIGVWTRLVDREMRLTGVEKPTQIALAVSTNDSDGMEVHRMLDQFFGPGAVPAGESHVIQGEILARSDDEA